MFGAKNCKIVANGLGYALASVLNFDRSFFMDEIPEAPVGKVAKLLPVLCPARRGPCVNPDAVDADPVNRSFDRFRLGKPLPV